MSTIRFENGMKVNFDGDPTPQDIEEVAQQLGIQGQQTQQEDRFATPLERAILSFGDAQGREQFMEERGIAESRVNRPGFDLGDITSKAGGAFPIIGGILGAIPGGLAGSIVPGAGTAAGAGLTGAAGAAAGEGVSQALGTALGVRGDDEASQEEALKDVGTEAALAGISPPVGKATTAGARAILGRTPRRLMQKAFRPAVSRLDKFANQGIDLLDEWSRLGVRGTQQQVKRQAENISRQAANTIDDITNKSDEVVDINDVAQGIIEEAGSLAQRARNAGNRAKADQIENITLDALQRWQSMVGRGGRMTVKQLQKIKEDISAEAGERYASEAGVSGAQRALNRGTRRAIEKVHPETADLNKTKRVARALVKTLDELDNRSAKGLIETVRGTTPEIVGTTVGGLAGGAIGGFPGAQVGGLAGLAGTRGLRGLIASTPSRTIRAQAIQGLENIPPAGQSAIGRLLQELR